LLWHNRIISLSRPTDTITTDLWQWQKCTCTHSHCYVIWLTYRKTDKLLLEWNYEIILVVIFNILWFNSDKNHLMLTYFYVEIKMNFFFCRVDLLVKIKFSFRKHWDDEINGADLLFLLTFFCLFVCLMHFTFAIFCGSSSWWK